MTDEDADRFERVARELTTMVAGLRSDMERAETVRDDLAKLTRSGKLIRWIVTVLGVVVIAILVVGAVVVGTIGRLNDVVATQHDSALCPLYQLFINSDTPASRDAARKRGDDMAQRDVAFATIRESYTALNCQAK